MTGCGFLGLIRALSVEERHSTVALLGVHSFFPAQGIAFQSCLVGDVTRQALAAENTEFDFRHIEPTAVFGDKMKLQSVQDTFGLSWGKHFIQGAPYGTRDIVGGVA